MSIFGFLKQADINAGVQEFLKTEKAVLLDVRTKEEYESGHIENSENIPLQQIEKVLAKITDKNTTLFVYCQSGLRSYISCRILSGEGFDCYNFSGGYRFYENVMRETNLIESSLPCGMDKE